MHLRQTHRITRDRARNDPRRHRYSGETDRRSRYTVDSEDTGDSLGSRRIASMCLAEVHMKGSETTLGDIFTLSAQDVSDRVSSAIKSDRSEAKGLPNQIMKKVAGEVGTRFGELLDVSLVDIMGSAWQKYASLWKY